MSHALAVHGLRVRFGPLRAVDDVDLAVPAGTIVGLIGPNGAGKTTVIDAVTGFVPAAGRVEVGRRDLTGLPPHRRARAGLARTWQTSTLFDDLTVAGNLLVAAHPSGVRPTRAAAERAERVERTLDVLGIANLAGARATQLSQGQRKLVDLGRALATGATTLCLDEPAAGLDSGESAELGARLRTVADGGTSLLIVDHDMGLVLGTCDEVYVLQFGRVVAHGTPQQVRADPAVVAAYLGAAPVEEGVG